MDLTTLLSLARLHALTTADWTVVVAGISVVLGTLMVLIVIFYIFGALVSKMEAASKKRAQKKAEKKAAKAAAKAQVVTVNGGNDGVTAVFKAPAPKAVPASVPAPVVESGISEEVVAAISAAVYSMEGAGATICSIRKKNPVTSRNPWAQAAVTENTKPF